MNDEDLQHLPPGASSPPLFGQPVNQEAMDARVQDGVIVVDLSCKHCGYNLRTRGVNDVCPECGSGVLWSLRGNELAWSDPDWLAQLHRGMFLQVLIIVLGFIVGAGVGFWGSFTAFGGGGAQTITVGSGTWQAGESIIGVIFGALSVAAYYYITRPDPASPSDSRRLRSAIFLWAVVSVGLNMFALLGALSASGVLADLATILSGIVAAGGYVAAAMLLVYLRRLGRRTDDAGIVTYTTTILYTGGIVCGLMLVVGAVAAFSLAGAGGPNAGGANAAGGPPVAWTVVMILGGVVGCVFFIVSLLYILLLDRYRRLFKKCRAEALQRVGSQGPTAGRAMEGTN